MNLSEYRFLPLQQAEYAEGLVHVIRDRWWIIHPEKGLAFFRGRSPQCNASREIVEMVLGKDPDPELAVVFLPVVYLPICGNDWDYKEVE